jgi:hypothetical protein
MGCVCPRPRRATFQNNTSLRRVGASDVGLAARCGPAVPRWPCGRSSLPPLWSRPSPPGPAPALTGPARWNIEPVIAGPVEHRAGWMPARPGDESHDRLPRPAAAVTPVTQRRRRHAIRSAFSGCCGGSGSYGVSGQPGLPRYSSRARSSTLMGPVRQEGQNAGPMARQTPPAPWSCGTPAPGSGPVCHKPRTGAPWAGCVCPRPRKCGARVPQAPNRRAHPGP